MTAPKIAIVGGGPAGLFAARLIKLTQPSADVVVYEEKPSHATFGFGITFSVTGQRTLGAADPDLWNDILAAAFHGHGLRMYSGSSQVALASRDQIAIGRTALLDILARRATEVGVELCVGNRRDIGEVDGEVIIAADGANSAIRRRYAEHLGVVAVPGRQRFLWCGTDFALPDSTFAAVQTPHGAFTTHAYPYAPDRSTFLIETAESTWRASGLAQSSTAEAAVYLQKVFAHHLNGHSLMVSAEKWSRFHTVTCRRWWVDNVVLLGDAAHTAHYSIGTGTKLAMQGAVSLARALLAHPHDPQAAFVAYQSERAADVTHAQALAERSDRWWEGFENRLTLPAERLLLSFLSRTGVSLDGFIAKEPALYRQAVAQFAQLSIDDLPDDITPDWIIDHAHQMTTEATTGSASSHRATHTVEATVGQPWEAVADAVVACCRALGDHAYAPVLLTGPRDRDQLLDRLDLSERLRTELQTSVYVQGPAELSQDLAIGLVSGRIDDVVLQ